MLESATPATTTSALQTNGADVTRTSPPRTTRLRGLSYLRNYTQHHLNSITSRVDGPAPTQPVQSPPSPGSAVTSSSPEPRGDLSYIQVSDSGWIPTIQGRSGLARDSPHPTSTSTASIESEPAGMTRIRTASTANGPVPAQEFTATEPRGMVDDALRENGVNGSLEAVSTPSNSKPPQPSIRFTPHVETRSTRPSLYFSAISRTLKSPSSIIRVGRYSERDHLTSDPDALPVGFKSKVVSRRHCEFWCVNGQWFVKDVKSSSGTFLNHVRLSPPNAESRPFPVNDGDVVQLGIDFKGGEEIIFRCVKIRVECNRGWQKSLNNFNTSAHKRLFRSANKAKSRESDAGSVNSSECSICLNPVAPCQALFVAPCSHVWHFKCIRNLIQSLSYPNFLCPNCRAVADLEADVEPPEDPDFGDEELFSDERSTHTQDHPTTAGSSNDEQHGPDHGPDDADGAVPDPDTDPDTVDTITRRLHQATITSSEPDSTSTTTASRPIPIIASATPHAPSPSFTSPTPSSAAVDPTALLATPTSTLPFVLDDPSARHGGEASAGGMDAALMTPRNNAGPFVFDGRDRRDEVDGQNGDFAGRDG